MSAVPSTIGRYQVIEEIGQGGMGVLYRARDPVLDREVALKVLLDFTPDSSTRERLGREARAAAGLQHRNIVTIHEFGEADGLPYIAMELLSGQDLETTIATHQPIALLDKVDIAIQLCDALSYAHDHGIVHRDVKPSNVRVLADGTVKVLDFGIARFAPNATTESVKVTGTPRYMAPEQITGQSVDGRTDVFSAGAVIYALFAGAPPFDGKAVADVLHEVLHATPVPLRHVAPDVPDQIAHLVARALEKEPANRYALASEMAAAFRSFRRTLTDAALRAAPPTAVSTLTATTPRRRWAWVGGTIILGGAGLTVLGMLGYLGHARTAPPPTPTPVITAPVEAPPVAPPEPADSIGMLTAVLDGAKELMRVAEKAAAKGVAADYHSIIDACTQVINTLTAKGQDADQNLLAAAFELRARARLATGDRVAAAADFTELLKIVPTWTLGTDAQPNVAIVFEQVRTKLDLGTKPPPPAAPAPPPPAPPPSAVVANVTSTGVPAVGATVLTNIAPPPPPPKPEPAPPPPPAPATTPLTITEALKEAVRTGGVFKEPVLIRSPQPVYPAAAAATKAEGTVVVTATIGPDGKISNPRLKTGVSKPLDSAALAAVRQWEYTPGTLNGQPIAIDMELKVTFVRR